MAENLTVARPYAQAAFDTALETDKIDAWQNMLYAMSLAVSNEYVMDAIKVAPNSKVASDSLISLLQDVLDESGINFVKIIGENNRFEVLPKIYEEYLRLRANHEKILDATLISARSFSDSEIKTLKDKLASVYNSKINLSLKIDETLIGGAVLKIGDKVIDASVKTSLVNLLSTLK